MVHPEENMRVYDENGNYIGYVKKEDDNVSMLSGIEPPADEEYTEIRKDKNIGLYWAKELADYSFAAALLSSLGFLILLFLSLNNDAYRFSTWFLNPYNQKDGPLMGVLPLKVLLITPAAFLLRMIMSVVAYLHNKKALRLFLLYCLQLLLGIMFWENPVFLCVSNVLIALYSHYFIHALIRKHIYKYFPDQSRYVAIAGIKKCVGSMPNPLYFVVATCGFIAFSLFFFLGITILFSESPAYAYVFEFFLILLMETVYYMGIQNTINRLI